MLATTIVPTISRLAQETLEFSIYTPLGQEDNSMKKKKFTSAQVAFVLPQALKGSNRSASHVAYSLAI